jgi:hypothetical protein
MDSFKKLSCGWRSTTHLLKNQEIKPIKNLALNIQYMLLNILLLRFLQVKQLIIEAVLSNDTLDAFFDGFFKSNIHLSLPNSRERFLEHGLQIVRMLMD